jgi:hypothetical protein
VSQRAASPDGDVSADVSTSVEKNLGARSDVPHRCGAHEHIDRAPSPAVVAWRGVTMLHQ